MGVTEAFAVVTGLACVILTVRQNIWCWPIGIISVILYIAVFYDARLYSDMGLQVVYIFMQIYGWRNWLHGGVDNGELAVSRLTPLSAGAWIAVAVMGSYSLGYGMSSYTNADLPYVDSTATTMSLVAQWLMSRKVLESWLIWITVDVISVAMYLVKGLYMTTGLYAVFLALAASGFLAWRNSLLKPERG